MPREPRRIKPGTPYHIISRFVDREWFIRSRHEREHYIKLLGTAVGESDWRLYSYCVMSNHIHLAARAGEDPFEDWIRRVHSPFATAMNLAYDRIGPMFVRGPRTFPVASPAFAPLLAYIHNNPVRAGVCNVAADSTWSSHRAYAGLVQIPKWLDVRQGLRLAGFKDGRAFDAWVRDPARCESEHLFMEETYDRDTDDEVDRERGAAVAARMGKAESIVHTASEVLGISLEQLQGGSRGRAEVLCRAVAVHCAASAGVSGRTIAGLLHLSEARVSALRSAPVGGVLHDLCDEVSRRVERASVSEGA